MELNGFQLEPHAPNSCESLASPKISEHLANISVGSCRVLLAREKKWVGMEPFGKDLDNNI
jgi:hypothetical protein